MPDILYSTWNAKVIAQVPWSIAQSYDNNKKINVLKKSFMMTTLIAIEFVDAQQMGLKVNTILLM